MTGLLNELYVASAVMLVFFSLISWLGFRILGKAGRSGLWVILLWFPMVIPIALWLFAFVRWPKVDDAGKPDVNAF